MWKYSELENLSSIEDRCQTDRVAANITMPRCAGLRRAAGLGHATPHTSPC